MIYDVRVRFERNRVDEWCRKTSNETGSVTSSIHLNFLHPHDNYLILYAPRNIDLDHAFRASMHEFIEATIILVLMEDFRDNFKMYKAIVTLGHILAEMSLYDGKKPIILRESRKIFRGIEEFLRKLGYNYTSE
jgi:hypothetical protein